MSKQQQKRGGMTIHKLVPDEFLRHLIFVVVTVVVAVLVPGKRACVTMLDGQPFCVTTDHVQ